MRLLRSALPALVITLCCPFAGALQSIEPWLPITPEDFGIRKVPGNAGGSAIVLYSSYFQDDDQRFVSVYRRIKILSDDGRKYADVEIRVSPGESLKELKARTIHPDGSIVDSQEKPFDKVIRKEHGLKYTAKAFALPDVSSGSIIEYSYVVNLRPHEVASISQWSLQSDLYILKERFRYRPTSRYVNVSSEWGAAFRNSQSICSYSNQVGSASPKKDAKGTLEIDLEDVAPFQSEEYMPPESDYVPSVTCYYGGHEFASADMFWDVWQKRITESIDKWIGKPSAVDSAVTEIIGNETDPETKLRRLYARVQQIRNLSYEVERTEKEEQRAKIKSNEDPKAVWQHGYGTHWEIDALFVALARAAGFDAHMAGIADRHERSFSRLILWLGQLDEIAIVVNLNGKDIFLDPGTRFCPFGVMPWQYSSATALIFKAGGGFTTTPEPSSGSATRNIVVTLNADGSAQGEIAVEYAGQEALRRRLEALASDEVGRRKDFEGEVQSWLPNGAVVEMTSSEHWESTTDEPLKAKFKITVPGIASLAGKRILTPVYFLPTTLKTMFAEGARAYPIDFPFPLTDSDEIILRFPSGFVLPNVPDPHKAGLTYAHYEITSSLDQSQLVTRRVLRFDGVSFAPEKYEQLKNFFTVVHHGDVTQAVLEPQSVNGAQKPD